MKRTDPLTLLLLLAVLSLSSCATGRTQTLPTDKITKLKTAITDIINNAGGETGVALIIDGKDIVTVNDTLKYPMMSVFKLHQALGVCNRLSAQGIALDTRANIARATLNPDTWSPMLKDFDGDTIHISYRDLLRYALEQSDNNASNYLFDKVASPEYIESYIATIIPLETFRIRYSEAEMLTNHRLAYTNATTPLGAARLIEKLYTDPDISTRPFSDFIRQSLEQCSTGKDRIAAPLQGIEGIRIGHKTGSGFRDNGILAAHNDVGYVLLPDGHRYALAIFVKDFSGDEKEASAIMARISATVLAHLYQK